MKNLNYCSPKNSRDFKDNLEDILCEVEYIKKRKYEVANIPCVFDIEASSFYNENNEKQCCMYAWVFGLNGRCIRGRTWSEFFEVINKLIYHYKLSSKRKLIIYVHNLSYEFQWFCKYFEWEKVFCVDARKPLYAQTKNGIEFRCSYLLSGYSLEVLGENLTKYKVNKQVGDLDYRLIRHSKTVLSEKEWGYILNDGLVVMAHIQEEIERLGDITKIPLTKTGYVRELCREKCLKGNDRWSYVRVMKTLKLSVDDYKQLKRAYSGGFTHANAYKVGRVLNNIGSFDLSSAYPSVMVSEKFPMSRAIPVDITSEEQFITHLKTYCCMFECKFVNIRSKVSYENYISLSKCYKIENYIINNGRIVEADMLQMTLTEQDFFIISKLYEWDYIEVGNFKKFFKDYLPKELVMTILELYNDKTMLKGVQDKLVEYLVSKGMINSVYGMCVTDICKDENTFTEGNWVTHKAKIDELIEAYNNNKQRVLFYAWGVWVTAYTRANLFKAICEFRDDYVYSDTDSVKAENYENHMDFITEFNKDITEKVRRCLKTYDIPFELSFPKTIKGVEKPIGVWDYEGCYSRFKTLGAKRYMYEQDGDIHITIAGVGKKAGVKYLKHTYGSITNIFNAFEEDLVFPSNYDFNGIDENGSGKLCHTYIDVRMEGYVVDYMGVKYAYNEESGVHMENTEFTLGLDHEFKNLLQGIKGGHLV